MTGIIDQLKALRVQTLSPEAQILCEVVMCLEERVNILEGKTASGVKLESDPSWRYEAE